jgi:hypothetical protein
MGSWGEGQGQGQGGARRQGGMRPTTGPKPGGDAHAGGGDAHAGGEEARESEGDFGVHIVHVDRRRCALRRRNRRRRRPAGGRTACQRAAPRWQAVKGASLEKRGRSRPPLAPVLALGFRKGDIICPGVSGFVPASGRAQRCSFVAEDAASSAAAAAVERWHAAMILLLLVLRKRGDLGRSSHPAMHDNERRTERRLPSQQFQWGHGLPYSQLRAHPLRG